MEKEQHWSNVYTNKSAREVSWYSKHLERSLALITSISDPAQSVIDVGGGASTLVDDLLAGGYRDLAVLDISAAALQVAQARLGEAGQTVKWLVSDIGSAKLAPARFDVWHDRAVFHFLTAAVDRAAYANQARLAVKPGGHLVMGTFAPDGPTRCSGLEVRRYDGKALLPELPGFALINEVRETHLTPAGAPQRFAYFVLRKV